MPAVKFQTRAAALPRKRRIPVQYASSGTAGQRERPHRRTGRRYRPCVRHHSWGKKRASNVVVMGLAKPVLQRLPGRVALVGDIIRAVPCCHLGGGSKALADTGSLYLAINRVPPIAISGRPACGRHGPCHVQSGRGREVMQKFDVTQRHATADKRHAMADEGARALAPGTRKSANRRKPAG